MFYFFEIVGIQIKAAVSYLYNLAGKLMCLCFQLHHKSYLDMSVSQGSRSSNFQIFLECKQKATTEIKGFIKGIQRTWSSVPDTS